MKPKYNIPLPTELSHMLWFFIFCGRNIRHLITSTTSCGRFFTYSYDKVCNFSCNFVFNTTNYDVNHTLMKNYYTTADSTSCHYVPLHKQYELSNHLGNVLATVSARPRLLYDGNYNFTHKEADVMSVSDYFPFGMMMPSRHWSSGEYRFGFNAQEKVNEIAGLGNHNTAEFWEYSTRTGRRWNLDPVDKPWQSRYHAFSNSPIWKIDPNGDSDGHYVDEEGNTLGWDGKDDNKHYLVLGIDIKKITENQSNNLPTPQSELEGDYFQLPTYEERQKFKEGVYEPAMSDQSREYGMHSTYTRTPDVFGYVYYKPGPRFELINGTVRGSVNPNLEPKSEGVENDKWVRFQAHSHNFNTFDFFHNETRYRQKPPSGSLSGSESWGGDTWAIRNFISGTVFDTENGLAYIYRQTQSRFGKMSINAFFKKFDNE